MSNENSKSVFYLNGDFLEIEQDHDLPPVLMDQFLMESIYKKAYPSITISTQLDYYRAEGKWKPTSEQLWKITVEKVVDE